MCPSHCCSVMLLLPGMCCSISTIYSWLAGDSEDRLRVALHRISACAKLGYRPLPSNAAWCVGLHDVSEVGGVAPKVSRPAIWDAAPLDRARDVIVSCVTCHACDVSGDRSIGRVQSEGLEINLWLGRSGGLFCFSFCVARFLRLEDIALSFRSFCSHVYWKVSNSCRIDLLC